MAFHGTDDLGVQAKPRAEGEVTVPGEAKADAAGTSRLYRLDDYAGGIDWILRNSKRSDEHVGQTTRYRGQRWKIRGSRPAYGTIVASTILRSFLAQQAVHHLVDRPVPTEREHNLAAFCHRFVG